jgi:type VI protein secretion system component VasF
MTSAVAPIHNPGLSLVPPLTRAEIELPDDPFLLTRFEEFYLELARLKGECSGRIRLSSRSAADTQQILAAFLSDQERLVEQTCTPLGVEMYRQAQRVMACLADEIFSAHPWPQGSSWPSLESQFFGTAARPGLSPGGECFRKVDQLLRQGDPVYRELASVYFYALALGKPGDPDTENILYRLRQMISLPATSSQVFAQSYAHTLSEGKITFLPSSRKWLWRLATLLLAWVALSWFLWAAVSAPVEKQLDEIRKSLQP